MALAVREKINRLLDEDPTWADRVDELAATTSCTFKYARQCVYNWRHRDEEERDDRSVYVLDAIRPRERGNCAACPLRDICNALVDLKLQILCERVSMADALAAKQRGLLVVLYGGRRAAQEVLNER